MAARGWGVSAGPHLRAQVACNEFVAVKWRAMRPQAVVASVRWLPTSSGAAALQDHRVLARARRIGFMWICTRHRRALVRCWGRPSGRGRRGLSVLGHAALGEGRGRREEAVDQLVGPDPVDGGPGICIGRI